jgi:hypothetical protein
MTGLPEWDLDVCGTCLCWVANGDDSGLELEPADYVGRIRAERARREAEYNDAAVDAGGSHAVFVPACDDGCGDGGFTHAMCELCGVTGRDAHRVTVWTAPVRDGAR